MDASYMIFLFMAVTAVALLYSTVGHAGASGYIAVMALFGFAVPLIKPTALVLNILVAIIGTIQFYRAGHFSWSLFWPFALLSVPAAFIGGYMQIPANLFRNLVGMVLLFSSYRLFFRHKETGGTVAPGRPAALSAGAVIGLLSGLTGTGGGIFLTPLMMFFRWAGTRQAAAVSAAFILVNSVAGLTGYLARHHQMPSGAWFLALAAVCGGLVGSWLGSVRLQVRTVQVMLACVLLSAGVKLILIR